MSNFETMASTGPLCNVLGREDTFVVESVIIKDGQGEDEAQASIHECPYNEVYFF